MALQQQTPVQEVIIVASANSAMASGDLISGNGYNLADGQLGLVAVGGSNSLANGHFLSAGEVNTDARYVRIVQGISNSGDFSTIGNNPTNRKGIVKSHKLDAYADTSFTAQLASYGTSAAKLVRGFSTPVNEKEYMIRIGWTGGRHRKFYGQAGERLAVDFVSPDYTTLSTPNPLDHMVKNLVYETNIHSAAMTQANPFSFQGNKLVIALGIDLDGAGTGTAVSGITAGDTLTVMTDAAGAYTWDIDQDSLNALSAITSSYANAEVVDANITTAGAAAHADAIVFIALDWELFHNDQELEANVKSKLNIGLDYQFDSDASVVVEDLANPVNRVGHGREWKLYADQRYQLNQYSQQSMPILDTYFIPPSSISETTWYNAFIIENNQSFEFTNASDQHAPKRVIILVPADPATGTDTVGTAVTSFEAILKPYIQSMARLKTKIPASLGAAYFG